MFSFDMDAAEPDAALDLSPFIIVYKDGSIERLVGNEIVPPSLDPKSSVLSKDAVYSKEAKLSSRLYLPPGVDPDNKLPLLIYFHGGGFCVESAFSPAYHNYLNILVNAVGVVLIHPYFWGKEPIGNEVNELERVLRGMAATWHLAYPTTSGCDDPLINPTTDPKLASFGCSKVLVAVAEKDLLRDRGLLYCETLKNSGWGGAVETMEAEGEGHVFHLFNPTCGNAVAMLKKTAAFISGHN